MSTEAFAPTRRSLATQAGALALFGPPASVFAAQGDVKLLRLGDQLELAWADERAATGNQALSDDQFSLVVDRTADIVHEIEKHNATTLSGLIVKARACCWCRSGEAFEDTAFADNATTDVRLAAAILRDLLALSVPPTRST